MVRQTFIFLLILFLVGCTKTIVEEIEEGPIETQYKMPQTQSEEKPQINQTQINKTHEIESEKNKNQEITEINSGDYLKKGISKFRTYTLELKGVAEDICGISVNNGQINWIRSGETIKVDNLSITVKEVIVSHSITGETDSCKVILQTD